MSIGLGVFSQVILKINLDATAQWHLGDAAIALTARQAIKNSQVKGKHGFIQFDEEWFDVQSDGVPEAEGAEATKENVGRRKEEFGTRLEKPKFGRKHGFKKRKQLAVTAVKRWFVQASAMTACFVITLIRSCENELAWQGIHTLCGQRIATSPADVLVILRHQPCFRFNTAAQLTSHVLRRFMGTKKSGLLQRLYRTQTNLPPLVLAICSIVGAPKSG